MFYKIGYTDIWCIYLFYIFLTMFLLLMCSGLLYLFWQILVWNLLFQILISYSCLLLTFTTLLYHVPSSHFYCVSLRMKYVSCMQGIIEFYILNSIGSLCIFMGELRPFTFRVIYYPMELLVLFLMQMLFVLFVCPYSFLGFAELNMFNSFWILMYSSILLLKFILSWALAFIPLL